MLIISSSAMPFYALANENAVLEERKNPFYEGKEIAFSTLDALETPAHSTIKLLGSQNYYSDGIELYRIMRNNLVARKTSFTLYYLSPRQIFIENVLDKIEKIYVYATDDTLSESPTDGDYIRWVVSSYGINKQSNGNYLDHEYKNGYYYYPLQLSFTYYDTASEEKEVDKVVNSFVSSIDTDSLTDYEVIKKIHDFICSKTTYDDDAAYDIENSVKAATAYGALVTGKCVCQGYAVAFYRLCKELGYNARFVSSDPDWGCHAWNIVGLDGKYYFVDATWDDAYIDEGEKDSAYTYFLVNYKNLRKDDTFISEHVLDSDYYDEEYFMVNYRNKLDLNDYNKNNKNLFSQSIITLSKKKYTYTGNSFTPAVNVTSKGSVGAYSVSYSNNKNPGMASADIMSEDGSAILSHRNFVIVPKKMNAPSLKSGGRTTNSINIKWNKPNENISGFSIEIYRYGKWNAVKTVSSSVTSAEINSLSSAATYKFRVRSFVNVSSRKYYGAYSDIYKTVTKPRKPTLLSVSTKSKSITLKWKSVNCSGYEIQYSTYKSMKNAKSVTASSTAKGKKISNLKKGKRYYVRIRAVKNYTTASGKSSKVYSARSTMKNIVCK